MKYDSVQSGAHGPNSGKYEGNTRAAWKFSELSIIG